MMSSGAINDEISTILELILKSDLDAARKRAEALVPAVRTERTRGALMALNGIITSMSKKKDGTLQSWDDAKILRASNQISKSQMIDDFDRGFSETLAKYAKFPKPVRNPE